MQKTKRERRNAWTGFFIGVALIIIFIVIIAISAQRHSGDRPEGAVATERAEKAPREKRSKRNKQQESAEAPIVTTTEGSVVAIEMEPYRTAPYLYKFEDITWSFSSQDEEGVGVPVTAVNFEFVNFSRHEGSYVNFGRPYKVGTYAGACQEVRALSYEGEYGRPIAFARCEGAQEVTEFAIFQNENLLAVSSRTVATGTSSSTTPFQEVYTLDMTTMVR